jgi:hypothetical protein
MYGRWLSSLHLIWLALLQGNGKKTEVLDVC